MALNLVNTIIDFLRQNPEQKFTAREIANWILKKYPVECHQKQQRSVATVKPLDNETALLHQIVAEIGSQRPRLQKQRPEIKTTEGRPRKYYFTESRDNAEIEQAESHEASSASTVNDSIFKEHDLYPIFSEFLWSELAIYSKRIDEKHSRNSRGPGDNKWLYPDLVGMEDLSCDWNREIKDCVQQYADKKTKLWSFEVKILINRSNRPRSFFSSC